ncbi:MAG TPA: hypothetical protein VFE91_02125 [Nitrososphaerales archaeon]|nr:hypothetical protein [Nitrososphaerales archaeon]
MSEEQLALKQMLEAREREYLMGKAKVRMRSSVENLESGDLVVPKLSEGEMAELPRWVADELVGLNMADNVEEPFETEIFRALSREKMMGPLQLSALGSDFYLRMRRKLAALNGAIAEGKARKEEVDRLRGICYDLVGIRLSKLLSLSSSATTNASLEGKVTPEEGAFFTASQSLSKEWRAALFGGAK